MTLLLLPLSLANPVPPAAAEEAPSAPSPAATLSFDEDLNAPGDLLLQGLAATRSLAFPVPRAWTLTADPVLDLGFDHSALLDPERSTLTVRVNDRSLASVRLTAENATDGSVRVVVPRGLLRPYNVLQLDVVQHLSDECEDPFDPGLWTRVSSTSTITMPHVPSAEPLDLVAFPYPLVDERGYGPAVVSLVEPGQPLGSELDALGRIGLALGRLAGYRTVEVAPPVATLDALTTNGLVVGIYGHDALVTELVGAPPPPETGVVRVLHPPHAPELSVLVVAGADEVGLRKAVGALVGQNRFPVLSGGTARVTEVAEAPVPPLSDEFRPFPRGRDTATLAELGLEDRTVRGYYAETVRVPVDLGGDARANASGVLRLAYAHSDLVDPRLSAVEVRLNGVVLRSRHLAGDGAEGRLDVTLPADLIEPDNELEIVFSLFPEDFDPCRRVSDRPLWATVLASSELTFSLDRYAKLPDLSLLRQRFWPLELESAGAALLLADQPTADDASAALQLAAELGRTSPAAEPKLTVASGRTPQELVGSDVLVLAPADRAHAGWSAYADAQRLTLTGDPARTLASAGTLLQAEVGTPYATVEGVRDGDRDALVLRAASGRTVLEATRALVDPARLAALGGNAAVLPEAGGARLLDVAPRVAVGKLSAGNRVQGWLREGWGLIGLGVPLAALLASIVIARWARGRGGSA